MNVARFFVVSVLIFIAAVAVMEYAETFIDSENEHQEIVLANQRRFQGIWNNYEK